MAQDAFSAIMQYDYELENMPIAEKAQYADGSHYIYMQLIYSTLYTNMNALIRGIEESDIYAHNS